MMFVIPMPHTELSTSMPGLVLRRITGGDADAYLAVIQRNQEHLTRYDDHRGLYPATRRSVLEDLIAGARHAFGVWLGDSFIGRVDLIPREDGNFVLGYWLDQQHTGHGYATSACEAVIQFGLSELDVTDVWAGVTKGNAASEKLLERLGFERVADMGKYTRFHLVLRQPGGVTRNRTRHRRRWCRAPPGPVAQETVVSAKQSR
jgi:RimJ/RimL family protein N-acetyltransferase